MYLVKNKKSPYFQLVHFVNGKRTTISTRTINRREAENFVFNFRVQQLQNPTKEETPKFESKQSIKISELEFEYIKYCSNIKSENYISSIKTSFKQIIEFLGDKNLYEISIKDIDQFINSTFKRTQRGAHLYYRTLKAAFTKAITWDYLEINPFAKIKFPKMQKSFPVFITEDEFLIILANTHQEHLKDLFTVAFYTGLRLSEIINMTWDWIDFTNNLITVKCTPNFQPKSKKERIIPMSEKVQKIISKRLGLGFSKSNDIVFYKTKCKILYPDFISRQFKRIARQSNLSEKIHFHTLRHSFASLLVQKGVSLYVVKELLGHEDLKTTQIYSHLQQDNLSKAISLL